jgi:cysteine-rich repeat protein
MAMLGRIGFSYRYLALLQVASLLACGPRLVASDTGEGTTTVDATGGSTAETAGSSTETGDSSTETADSSTETETSTDDGTCGDGVVDPDEECDDGNLVDADACSARCMSNVLPCDGHIYECGDGSDNDNDGLIDTDDPECNGPCDDAEDSLCEYLGNLSNDCKIDCAFDPNVGTGDDHCEGDWGCYPNEIGCEPPPEQWMLCTFVEPECLDFCLPLLPNGCDCYGCCELDGQTVKLNSGSYFGSDSYGCCDLDNLDLCQTCELRLDCFNPCEPESCELCFAQTIDELELGCTEPSCPPGGSPCASTDDCAEGWFCQTGCCRSAP